MATGGRAWEGFSNDPYLAGALVGPTITAMQESVIACVKHLVANEQESNRLPFLAGVIPQLGVQSVSSNLDDRTMHELYLWPFYDAIRAEPGSVMCSYNQINGSYGCQNSKTMNGLLKNELGFRGFVVSDWYAVHTGIATNNAGLDMVMPSSRQLTPKSLAAAVANGSVDSARLDDQATRILAAWYRYAHSQTPGIDDTADIDARDPASASTLHQSAIEGQVLVKNANNALPLKRPQYLNLFGYDAVGGINGSSADATEATLVNSGLANTQAYTDGRSWGVVDLVASLGEVLPQPYSGPSVALNGTLLTGGGSGAITPTFSVSPFDAFQREAKIDNTTLHYDFTSATPYVKYPTAPCIVFINAQSSESWDRSSLFDDYSDNLVLHIASQCSNTIVSIHNAGPRIVDAWIDHPNVTAAIVAHTPGQESGNALVEVIYGKQSPSGRMPYTLAKQESDYGALLSPTLPDGKNRLYPESDFTEGLNIDVRDIFLSFGKNNRHKLTDQNSTEPSSPTQSPPASPSAMA
jgi:beta-glucosidase